MNERTKIINKIWDDIHGENWSIFYWSDNTETVYYYDEITDTIKSENGFCVPVDKPTHELNKWYIRDLIDKLESIIILYYRHVIQHELWGYN